MAARHSAAPSSTSMALPSEKTFESFTWRCNGLQFRDFAGGTISCRSAAFPPKGRRFLTDADVGSERVTDVEIDVRHEAHKSRKRRGIGEPGQMKLSPTA